MSETPLVIQGVGHDYDEPVLHDVSLSVKSGELLSLLGDSGSGKTTLLRAICGLLTPKRGRILVDGVAVSENGKELVTTEKRRVGLLFQDYALFGHLNVEANVAFGASDPGLVTQLIELVGLTGCERRLPKALSGGQQQRVALARALAATPSLLLLDEPFANVDHTQKHALAVELTQILRRRQMTAIMVTHDRHDAMAYADRIAAMVPGPKGASLAQVGTPETLYNSPCSEAVARLLGPANTVSGHANGLSAVTPLGVIKLQEPREGPVKMITRPEFLQFDATENGKARVARTWYQGTHYLLEVTAADTTVIVQSTAPMAVGQTGSVSALKPLETTDRCR